MVSICHYFICFYDWLIVAKCNFLSICRMYSTDFFVEYIHTTIFLPFLNLE